MRIPGQLCSNYLGIYVTKNYNSENPIYLSIWMFMTKYPNSGVIHSYYPNLGMRLLGKIEEE